MKAVRRHPDGRSLTFQKGERTVLAQLVAALIEVVAELLPDDGDELGGLIGREIDADDIAERDPALHRLFPAAYPDDPEADAEFRRYTEVDSARAKIDSAVVVWNALRDGDRVVVHEADLSDWLRTLTSIRLLLAERDDSDLEEIYEWVGWVLESMLTC